MEPETIAPDAITVAPVHGPSCCEACRHELAVIVGFIEELRPMLVQATELVAKFSPVAEQVAKGGLAGIMGAMFSRPAQ